MPAAAGPIGVVASTARGPGDGDFHEGAAGAPGGAVIFADIATTGAAPCDAGGHELEVESTTTRSIHDVWSYSRGGHRADSRPPRRRPPWFDGARWARRIC